MLKRILLSLIATQLLTSLAFSQEFEPMAPVEGVKIAKLSYVASDSQAIPKLESAIAKAFEIPKGQLVLYQFNAVELAKGKKHCLVVLEGPNYGGSGGSSAALFENGPQGYRLVTRFTLFRTPVVVANSSKNGWKDLIVRTSGGGMPAQFSKLQFDGKTYPSNPTTASALSKGSVLSGTAYLATKGTTPTVLKFKAP